MTTQSEKNRFYLFIGFLAIIAFAINGFFLSRQDSYSPSFQLQTASKGPQQSGEIEKESPKKKAAQDSAEAERKVAEKAAAERARYLKKYWNQIPIRRPGIQTVGLSVGTKDGLINADVTAALIQHFKSDAVEINSAVFTREFVSDGLIDDLFNESATVIDKLELSKSLDVLLLARQTVQYSTNSSALANVLTAAVRLEIMALPVAKRDRGHTWTFASSGAGFKQADARAMAEERVIKQIAADTKMSLHSP